MPTIRTSPTQAWDASENHTLRLNPLTLRDGLDPTDYGTFTLTIRQDPLWPRRGIDAAELNAGQVDPIADGWPVVATGTATGGADDEEILIEVTVPAEAGTNRYAFDVVADGGSAGRVQVVPATMLTVRPSLMS